MGPTEQVPRIYEFELKFYDKQTFQKHSASLLITLYKSRTYKIKIKLIQNNIQSSSNKINYLISCVYRCIYIASNRFSNY